MAAALLAHHLDPLRVDAAVRSAGTRTYAPPVDPHAVRAVCEWGIDLTTHQPRAIDRSIVTGDGADLIITMTRQHLRDVAARERTAWTRTFTLREVVRRASALDASLRWDEWVDALGHGRRAVDMLGDDLDDDIADPYGAGQSEVNRTARALHDLTHSLARLAPWPGNDPDTIG